jgi:hypothetical protein
MNELAPEGLQPQIRIRLDGTAVAIFQHRPDVLGHLAGRPVDAALQLIPRLLPICGVAQSVAATRAIEAALGQTPEPGVEQGRERRLLREQALSAGWRLAVDWPDLMGAPRSMDWLRSLRAAPDDRVCAMRLAQALPAPADAADPDRLRRWLAQADGAAAAVPAAALAADPAPTASVTEPLRQEALAKRARQVLSHGQAQASTPSAGPVEVGPLAMQRAPLVAQFGRQVGAIPARLIAQLLDMCHIARALGDESQGEDAGGSAWSEDELTGTGCALTARGPVFHRVRLDRSGQVVEWRSVAPTDWHFAAQGAAARQLSGCRGEGSARLTIAGFDPCAPWCLESGSAQPGSGQPKSGQPGASQPVGGL